MDCEHKGCHCTETELEIGGRRFCSEKCANTEAAAGTSDRGCPCGHPECTTTI